MTNKKRMLRFLILGVAILASAGCVKSTCEQIRAHADDCGSAGAQPSRATGGLCELFRNTKGQVGLDTFAACVTKLRCDDKPGYRACIAAVSDTETPACVRLNTYLVGCGLETASGKDDCSEYGGTEQTPAFINYVDCIVQRGCVPVSQAEASLDECRTEALGNAEANFTSCQRVENRAKQCNETLPTVATCLAQTANFTAASVKLYADCYQLAACGDLAARTACARALEVDPNTDPIAGCEAVSAFTSRCNLAQIPGLGSAATCNTALRGFTEASRALFAQCLDETGCTDTAALGICVALLQPPTQPQR